jgi:hypothetical protein
MPIHITIGNLFYAMSNSVSLLGAKIVFVILFDGVYAPGNVLSIVNDD